MNSEWSQNEKLDEKENDSDFSDSSKSEINAKSNGLNKEEKKKKANNNGIVINEDDLLAQLFDKGKKKNKKQKKKSNPNKSNKNNNKNQNNKINKKKKKNKKVEKERKKGQFLTDDSSDDSDTSYTTATTTTSVTSTFSEMTDASATTATSMASKFAADAKAREEGKKRLRYRISKHLVDVHIPQQKRKFEGICEKRANNNVMTKLDVNEKYIVLEERDGCMDHECYLKVIPCDYDYALVICSKGCVLRFHQIADSEIKLDGKKNKDKHEAHGAGQCLLNQMKRMHKMFGLENFDENDFDLCEWSHDMKCLSNATKVLDEKDEKAENFYVEYDAKTGIAIEGTPKEDEIEYRKCNGFLDRVCLVYKGEIRQYLLSPPENSKVSIDFDAIIAPATRDDERIEEAHLKREEAQIEVEWGKVTLFFFCFLLFS